MLELDLQLASDHTAPSEALFRQWCELALRQRSADSELTIRLVDEPEGRELNRTWRQKDYATNVLSFPYVPNPEMAGDLVLCLPVVLQEAEQQRKPLEDHFAHLIVHGILHLQGYDHETGDADAEIMEAREREILAALGYPDPYLSERELQA